MFNNYEDLLMQGSDKHIYEENLLGKYKKLKEEGYSMKLDFELSKTNVVNARVIQIEKIKEINLKPKKLQVHNYLDEEEMDYQFISKDEMSKLSDNPDERKLNIYQLLSRTSFPI